MTRSTCWFLNFLVPGAGLVPIRREWLGIALALLFALSINLWIAGQWIAPVAVPSWLSLLALCIGIAGWAAAQALMMHLGRRHDAIDAEVDSLLAQAALDIRRNDADGARMALEAALALNGERPDVLTASADLSDSRGLSSEAGRIRRRILQVAPRSKWAVAAQESLSGRSGPESKADAPN